MIGVQEVKRWQNRNLSRFFNELLPETIAVTVVDFSRNEKGPGNSRIEHRYVTRSRQEGFSQRPYLPPTIHRFATTTVQGTMTICATDSKKTIRQRESRLAIRQLAVGNYKTVARQPAMYRRSYPNLDVEAQTEFGSAIWNERLLRFHPSWQLQPSCRRLKSKQRGCARHAILLKSLAQGLPYSRIEGFRRYFLIPMS